MFSIYFKMVVFFLLYKIILLCILIVTCYKAPEIVMDVVLYEIQHIIFYLLLYLGMGNPSAF